MASRPRPALTSASLWTVSYVVCEDKETLEEVAQWSNHWIPPGTSPFRGLLLEGGFSGYNWVRIELSSGRVGVLIVISASAAHDRIWLSMLHPSVYPTARRTRYIDPREFQLNLVPSTMSRSRYVVCCVPLWAPTCLFVSLLTLDLVRGPLRRWYRRARNRCVGCTYDLTGNLSGACPECGLPIRQANSS